MIIGNLLLKLNVTDHVVGIAIVIGIVISIGILWTLKPKKSIYLL